MKMAFSAGSLIRFLMTYTNWPTVRSWYESREPISLKLRGGRVEGLKLNGREGGSGERTDGTRYFLGELGRGVKVSSAVSAS